jgi:hypothetical protein
MIVRGAGEGFNLMVPVRRMKAWAEKNDIMWAIDPNEDMPSMDDILGMQIEDSGVVRSADDDDDEKSIQKHFPFRIKILPNQRERSPDRVLRQLPLEDFTPKFELKY